MPTRLKLRARHGLALGLLLLLVGGQAVKHRQRPTRDDATPAASSSPIASHAALPVIADAGVPKPAAAGVRIEGIVIDEHEDPLPGARVEITNSDLVVTTELDGSFGFDAVPPDEQTFVASKDDLVTDAITILVQTMREPLILRVHEAPQLVLHVVDATGPLPGATVEYVGRESITDATGTVRLRGLRRDGYQLEVSAPGHALASLSVLADGDPQAVLERTITLKPGASVDGVVLGPDGAPVAGASVSVFGTWQEHSFTTKTDAHGAWRVDELETGRTWVNASSERYPDSTAIKVDVDAATPVHGLVVQLVDGAEIDGTVADASGAPIANARVILWRPSGGLWDQTTTDVNGAFAKRALSPGEVHVLAVSADRGAPPVVTTVASGQRVSVALIAVPSRIAGTVVDAHGIPIAEAHVTARSNDPAQVWLPDAETRSDGHGRFAFASIAPGTYTIRAAPPGRGDEATVERAVDTGSIDVVVVVPALATITGRAMHDGAPVAEIYTRINNAVETSHASDGRFTRTGIAAGDMYIEISAPYTQVARPLVHLDPGATIDLGDVELGETRRVSGHVTFPDGTPVVGAIVMGGNATDSLMPPVREHLDGFQAVTDETGAYAADDVGTDDIAVHATFERTQSTRAVAVPAGDAVVDLVMLPTGTVVVSVIGTALGSVGIRDPDGEMQTSYGLGDGDPPTSREAEFSLLRPGEYTVEAERRDGTTLTTRVTVAGNDTVRTTIGP